jgi:hypothetical protein
MECLRRQCGMIRGFMHGNGCFPEPGVCLLESDTRMEALMHCCPRVLGTTTMTMMSLFLFLQDASVNPDASVTAAAQHMHAKLIPGNRMCLCNVPLLSSAANWKRKPDSSPCYLTCASALVVVLRTVYLVEGRPFLVFFCSTLFGKRVMFTRYRRMFAAFSSFFLCGRKT